MIIDVHAHVCAAPELYQWKSVLMSARGAHGFAPKKFPDEWVRDHADTKRNLRIMDSVGTDVQFVSPRPFQLMHAEKPVKLVEAWAIANHNYIAQQVAAFPQRFQGVCAFPQAAGEPVSWGFGEMERCVRELGFIGTLIDTDPGEGDNSTPTLADEYWYPLWEKMIELDIPGLIHSSGCKHGRETYSQHFISEESLAVLVADQLAGAGGFPEAEDHRRPWRGLHPLPDRALAGGSRHEGRRHGGTVQPPPEDAVLRYVPALEKVARDADRHRGQRARAVRHGKSGLGIGGESGDGQELRRHQAADRRHRPSFGAGQGQHLRGKRPAAFPETPASKE